MDKSRKSGEILVKPSIENIDPFKTYQFQTPKFYSLQENPILYGGSRDWILNINTFQEKSIKCDLFVLHTSFIIWFNDLNKGLELIYQDIILHAVQGTSSLYLQIEFNNEIKSLLEHLDILITNENDYEYNFVEFNFTTSHDKQKDSSIKEDLFTITNFDEDVINNPVQSVYNALSKCTAFHGDPTEDSDCDFMEQDEIDNDVDIAGPSLDQLKYSLKNYGQADDIDDIEDIDDIAEIFDNNDNNTHQNMFKSALDVEINSGCENAKIRPRNSELQLDNVKKAKIVENGKK
ncbi:Lot5p ASCRUDRAFT_69869 [Ascoidea rubescens DSM 1968]|uniref:Protein LOT5 n=1 Tax=Ascoidea rubescens DSM 1968 TaxID=1344418 RepID=A0A1D2VI91_9ASCO|nr:hypothetical protein ASCRUDRAFT_69869 [Ascoidea rubescens DSM 1968]ODV61364.1 hypothetical protein ASCRUDRAFT_69869 [Ascoidea rubescens DSM 1968]